MNEKPIVLTPPPTVGTGRRVILPIGAWNLGNGRLSDVGVYAAAWVLSEAADQDDLLHAWCDRDGLTMVRPDSPGAASTPVLYDDRRLRYEGLTDVLLAEDQPIGPGTGPDHMKTKRLIAPRFTDRATGRRVVVGAWHRPPGQKPGNKREDIATAMAGKVVAQFKGYRGLVWVGGDGNSEPDVDSTRPLRAAGWTCDQLAGQRLPTHGAWCPDHLWYRPDDRALFLGHETHETHSDHDILVGRWDVLKRKNVR